MGHLKAGVQYNDWKGTAAADNVDDPYLRLSDFLKKRGELDEGELVVGIELWTGENHGGPAKQPEITAYITSPGYFENVKKKLDAEADPLDLKQVRFEISFEDFFGFFKRFNIVITQKGLGIDGREYAE